MKLGNELEARGSFSGLHVEETVRKEDTENEDSLLRLTISNVDSVVALRLNEELCWFALRQRRNGDGDSIYEGDRSRCGEQYRRKEMPHW